MTPEEALQKDKDYREMMAEIAENDAREERKLKPLSNGEFARGVDLLLQALGNPSPSIAKTREVKAGPARLNLSVSNETRTLLDSFCRDLQLTQAQVFVKALDAMKAQKAQ